MLNEQDQSCLQEKYSFWKKLSESEKEFLLIKSGEIVHDGNIN